MELLLVLVLLPVVVALATVVAYDDDGGSTVDPDELVRSWGNEWDPTDDLPKEWGWPR